MGDKHEKVRTDSESTTTTDTIPEFEVIVGEVTEPMDDGESSFENAAECFRIMDDGGPDSADLSDIMDRLRRKHEKGELTGGNALLTSTATTVSSTMATQWISHMKKSFKRRSVHLSDEQQGILKRIVTEELYAQHGPSDLSIRDMMTLYSRGLEAHHDGRYREMFARLRPCMPFFTTNVLVWIRISEALVYEFYEEVWEFHDIYARLFDGCPQRYVPSGRRRSNELRPRHCDMNLQFAETATLMTFAMAKQSQRESVHYAAVALHSFLLLKLKKYTDAIETVNYMVDKYSRIGEWRDDLAILLTYKAEGMIGIGRYNRAIEYGLRVLESTKSERARHRAAMLIAMAYMRKNNFKKAHEYVLSLLNEGRLDENMLENVALLGLNLAHLMGNMQLFKRFEEMLQLIVY